METKNNVWGAKFYLYLSYFLLCISIVLYVRFMFFGIFEFYYERQSCSLLSGEAVNVCLELNQVTSLSLVVHSCFAVVLFICSLSFYKISNINTGYLNGLSETMNENKKDASYKSIIFYSFLFFCVGRFGLFYSIGGKDLFMWYTDDLMRISAIILIANVLVISYHRDKIQNEIKIELQKEETKE